MYITLVLRTTMSKRRMPSIMTTLVRYVSHSVMVGSGCFERLGAPLISSEKSSSSCLPFGKLVGSTTGTGMSTEVMELIAPSVVGCQSSGGDGGGDINHRFLAGGGFNVSLSLYTVSYGIA